MTTSIGFSDVVLADLSMLHNDELRNRYTRIGKEIFAIQEEISLRNYASTDNRLKLVSAENEMLRLKIEFSRRETDTIRQRSLISNEDLQVRLSESERRVAEERGFRAETEARFEEVDSTRRERISWLKQAADKTTAELQEAQSHIAFQENKIKRLLLAFKLEKAAADRMRLSAGDPKSGEVKSQLDRAFGVKKAGKTTTGRSASRVFKATHTEVVDPRQLPARSGDDCWSKW